ncbi:MAG: ParB/RepB/Spo0J family partition protein [archaeon]|nr:ParB/RepB/Spo0J family partition protein [archaeon]
MQINSEQQIQTTPRNTIELSVSSIHQPSFFIRRNLGDLTELKESILKVGLLHPIVVRKTSFSEFQLVCGNRRFEAMRQLGMKTIPAVISDLDDKGSFEVFMVENIQRQTLSPLEEARAFYSYTGPKERKCYNYGKVSELAKKIGKSQEYISNRLRLLKLPEWLLEDLFAQKNFFVSHAEELASLADDPVKLKELAELLMNNKISVRTMERAIPFVRSGIDVKSAIELAKAECDLKVEWRYESKNDHKEYLFEKSKKILESSLSYVDNVMRNFESDPDLYSVWIKDVRLKVHEAIDGVISCERNYKKKNKLLRTGHQIADAT